MKNKLFDKLAAAEQDFAKSQFLAPALRNRPIRVRIAGVVLHVYPHGRDVGWCIWRHCRPGSRYAKFVRKALPEERQAYLQALPGLRLVLCRNENGQWHGIPVGKGDTRFGSIGMVPIMLCDEVQIFDTVLCRFDGGTIWFDSVDYNANPQAPVYLREQLVTLAEPDMLALVGLSPAEHDAYQIVWAAAVEADIESKKDKQEERIKVALVKAGAVYRSYIDRGDTYTVEYSVDGQSYRSVIKKDDLSVETAGVCLDGTDKLHDLTTLANVLRVGQERRRIVRLGENQRLGGNSPIREYEDDDEYDE
jgi:hypothetical protein